MAFSKTGTGASTLMWGTSIVMSGAISTAMASTALLVTGTLYILF